MKLAPPNKLPNIYLDHAAATPVDPVVCAAMEPFLSEHFSNPSSLYRAGRLAKRALGEARTKIANVVGLTDEGLTDEAATSQIIFTGSGTESDNLAILGVARAAKKAGHGNHVITSTIEHRAVLKACEVLEQEGFEITRLPVDEFGLVSKQSLAKALRTDTILVSIMYANNEIGTVQSIAELAALAHKNGALFHTDACQAAGFLPLNVKKLGVDLMTLNAGKIYGPKGVGLLYVRNSLELAGKTGRARVLLEPLIVGGAQENRRRAGTENVAAIVGFAKALELAEQIRLSEPARLATLRDYFFSEIKKKVPDVLINGHPTLRLPNNIHLAFKDISGESLVAFLDEFGVAAATGSACDSQSFEPSHVAVAIGLPFEYLNGCLRLTMGRTTQKQDLEYILNHLPKIVAALRDLPNAQISTTHEVKRTIR